VADENFLLRVAFHVEAASTSSVSRGLFLEFLLQNSHLVGSSWCSARMAFLPEISAARNRRLTVTWSFRENGWAPADDVKFHLAVRCSRCPLSAERGTIAANSNSWWGSGQSSSEFWLRYLCLFIQREGLFYRENVWLVSINIVSVCGEM